ncbi:hypothetical protein Pelo_7749 [Pelomyxa schiedti]|nr:hypothetical protein Pelo_7749 [Pelomyxa schiedti]
MPKYVLVEVSDDEDIRQGNRDCCRYFLYIGAFLLVVLGVYIVVAVPMQFAADEDEYFLILESYELTSSEQEFMVYTKNVISDLTWIASSFMCLFALLFILFLLCRPETAKAEGCCLWFILEVLGLIGALIFWAAFICFSVMAPDYAEASGWSASLFLASMATGETFLLGIILVSIALYNKFNK